MVKRLIIVMLLFWNGEVLATTLSDAAKNLGVRQWVQITPVLSGLTDIMGVSGGYISEYGNATGWDGVNLQWLYCGQNHGTQYVGRCVAYTDSNNTFSEIAWPSDWCKSGTSSSP